MIVDEDYNMLERSVAEKSGVIWPRRLILLSAQGKEEWTRTQALSFQTGKGRVARYIDATIAFPKERKVELESEPDILPEDPELLVEHAVQQS